MSHEGESWCCLSWSSLPHAGSVVAGDRRYGTPHHATPHHAALTFPFLSTPRREHESRGRSQCAVCHMSSAMQAHETANSSMSAVCLPCWGMGRGGGRVLILPVLYPFCSSCCIPLHTLTHSDTHTHTHPHSDTQTHTHTHTHTHTQAHTYKHTQVCLSSILWRLLARLSAALPSCLALSSGVEAPVRWHCTRHQGSLPSQWRGKKRKSPSIPPPRLSFCQPLQSLFIYQLFV